MPSRLPELFTAWVTVTGAAALGCSAAAALGCSAAATERTVDEQTTSGGTAATTGASTATGTTASGGVTTGSATTTSGTSTGSPTTGSSAATTSAATTGSASTTSGSTLNPTDPSVHHFVAGGYYVDGPNVYDATGKKHMFHGLDRPSLEWDPAGQNLSAQNYTAMKAWRANVVRLSMNEAYWNNNQGGYQNTIKTQVTQIEQAGMDVILDLHRTPGAGDTANHQQCAGDQGSVTFWTSVASAYKGDGKVLFELFNEPAVYNNWGFWLNGGPVTNGNPGGCMAAGSYTAVGMQQLYAAVRGTGAQNLVVIGGINSAYDLSFATAPSYAIKDAMSPYNDGNAYNVMFAAHPYNDAANNKMPSNWQTFFGDTAKTAPVILTEFGDVSSCDGSFNQQVIAYADANNIHWTGWAWWNAGCAFPSLVSDVNNGTPTTAGMPVKNALAAYP